MADLPTLENEEYTEYHGKKLLAPKPKPGSAATWLAEIEKAEKRDDAWITRGRKIVKRYRDEKPGGGAGPTNRRKFNILWSNVQTLKPAIYGRRPEPICERRFLDHDPVARIASTILERTLRYDIEDNGFHEHMDTSVNDYLLVGRGVLWARYEAQFGEETSPEQMGGSPYDEKGSNGRGNPDDQGADSTDPAGSGNAGSVEGNAGAEEGYDAGNGVLNSDASVVDECVYGDYVFWEDFLHSQARVWSEVTWISRRLYMGKSELKERAKQTGIKAWLKVPLERPRDMNGKFARKADGDEVTKGEVFELWCKDTRKVKFIARGMPEIIEERDDPLGLEGFWPTPRPMYATQTSETLEPVPDYAEYQDQADELDSLTNRISSLIRSLKVAGVYDASAPGLERILDEGVENKLIPVEAWAAFAAKGGIDGSISWMPIKEIAAVLIQLFEARERIKQDAYEITGMSDIVRGQSSSVQPVTATEQNIKGQFATQRLQARQAEVARYARDFLAIQAEISAEHYAPETLILKSSIMEDDGLTEDMPAEQMQSGMGRNGGPPMDGTGMPVDPQQAKLQQIMAAIALLKDEKLRGFRIDIETDSTIAINAQQDKETTVEFVTAISAYMEKMVEASMTPAAPIVVPFAGKMLGWAVRRFRTGRDLEAAADQMIDAANQAMAAQAQQPEQPDPQLQVAQVKGQAEMAKAQIEGQIADLEGKLKIAEMNMQAQVDEATADQQKQLKVLEYNIKVAQAQADERKAIREEELAQREHDRKMAAMTMQAEVDRETEAAKKAAAKSGGMQ